MSANFSGVSKAGKALVLWSLNSDQAVKVSSFPVTNQFDVLSGTFTDAIKGICIATGVDPILLAIQGGGLVNSGDSTRAVIEYMQAKSIKSQRVLENFYNTVMIPNLQVKTEARVQIKQYSPIDTAITVEDKFWDVLTDNEKKDFVKKNIPGMADIIAEVTTLVDPETGEELTPEETQLNDNLTNLTGRQQIQLNRISRQFNKGEITFEQAAQLLKQGFGFDDADVNIWLGVTPTE